MKKHLKATTRVKVKNYSVELNGLSGTVISRNGEYYKIKLDNIKGFFELYLCELVELNRVIHSNNIKISQNKT